MPTVSSDRTSSAVSVTICLTSAGVRSMPRSLAALMTRPNAPDAWPVANEPVSPTALTCTCAPYCVRLLFRKKVPTGACAPSPTWVSGRPNSLASAAPRP